MSRAVGLEGSGTEWIGPGANIRGSSIHMGQILCCCPDPDMPPKKAPQGFTSKRPGIALNSLVGESHEVEPMRYVKFFFT